MPDAVNEGLQRLGRLAPGDSTVWRCMGGKVQWCKENPGPHIPAAITGHATIYLWECQGGEPRIVKQVSNVDPRGFVADFWFEISP